MRAEFVRAGNPERTIGAAVWTASGPVVEADDEDARRIVARIFRSIPVPVDDASLRVGGTAGTVVLQPGSLQWFLAAARSRAAQEGLEVGFRPTAEGVALPWDPAGAYRTFVATAERTGVARPTAPPVQAGERRADGQRGPSQSGTEAAESGAAPSEASDAPRPTAP